MEQLSILVTLAGGLALFLFGFDMLARALKQVSGDYLKTFLARMTRNRFLGLAAGAVVTAVIQSSSVTTVLLVGFISAGMMSLAQSVPIIIGANVGSTFTAQILAFNVTALALPMVSLGVLGSFAARRDEHRELGRILLGLGLVFYGMTVMAAAMAPLREHPQALQIIRALDAPLLAAFAGAAFTAVVQSSAATTGILLVMAGEGLITLEAAIALALGANIGTCVTALLASIGKPAAAVRAAVVHVLFNVAGVLIWIGLIDQLADFARWISPAHPALEGAARLQAEAPRQIANVHTFFNVANALLFIGFMAPITRLVERLVPERSERIEPRFAPRHLDPKLLAVPPIALDAARLELLRLGRFVQELLAAAVPTLVSGSPVRIGRLRVMDRPVDLLHRQIVDYLRQVSLLDLTTEQADRLMAYLRIANDLEHLGDLIATGMVTSARKRIDENVVIGPQTAARIGQLHALVAEAMTGCLAALETEDRDRAAAVRAMKQAETQLVEEISRHQAARLRAAEPRRLPAYAREIELIEGLDDVFKTIRRIARTQMGVFQPRPPDGG
ncbi:Na/Pi cotransporter family protein [Maritimibacter sp. 55A14]|uniref:Na/Pi cotransporter family protein n=1 Tax=Maritimibacter sp. 55A14 TaxID=2174844 RepID=UPI001304FCE2|nr:Na/Pi cotransporter family protein [Maritimibacter sp. 55A14]